MRECGKMTVGRRVLPFALAASLLAAASSPATDDLTEGLREAQKTVVSVRKQEFTRAVPEEEIGGSRLKALLEEKFQEGLPLPAEDYFRCLAALGLIGPADLPGLKDRLLEFYRSQVLAFYDPSAGKFFVSTDVRGRPDGLAGAERSLVFTHELTHALQDQHLSLDRRMKELKNDSDAQMALDAMLEGEATEVMIEAAVRDVPGGDEMVEAAMAPLLTASLMDLGPSASQIPEFFADQLIFPYSDGTAFIRERKKHGGWSAIDRAWASPPKTTSEILHPSDPISPARGLLPPVSELPPPPGYRDLYRDNLGEWSLRFLLRKGGVADADALAARWRGDRFAFFGKGERVAFAGRIRMADAASALRLLEAWKKANPASQALVRSADVIVFQGYEKSPIQ